MENPIILINKKDFEILKKENAESITNFKEGNSATFEGVPIHPSFYVERDVFTIYDNKTDKL